MEKFIEYGPWHSVKCCPSCGERVGHSEIYDTRTCGKCGHSERIMITYDTAVVRKAYIKRGWFRDVWEYQEKARYSYDERGYAGSAPGGAARTLNGLPLTIAAASVAIF